MWAAPVGGFGYGQSWQNVTAGRSFGVTYTNNTQKPIWVSFTSTHSGGTAGYVVVNGTTIQNYNFDSGVSPASLNFVVPAGNQYAIVNTVGGHWSPIWAEFR